MPSRGEECIQGIYPLFVDDFALIKELQVGQEPNFCGVRHVLVEVLCQKGLETQRVDEDASDQLEGFSAGPEIDRRRVCPQHLALEDVENPDGTLQDAEDVQIFDAVDGHNGRERS